MKMYDQFQIFKERVMATQNKGQNIIFCAHKIRKKISNNPAELIFSVKNVKIFWSQKFRMIRLS